MHLIKAGSNPAPATKLNGMVWRTVSRYTEKGSLLCQGWISSGSKPTLTGNAEWFGPYIGPESQTSPPSLYNRRSGEKGNMKYRKRSAIHRIIIIEAVRWDGVDYCAIEDLFGGTSTTGISQEFTCINPAVASYATTGRLRIKTLEGTMIADEGDWIIKGNKGDFYICKPDIFEATYEPVG